MRVDSRELPLSAIPLCQLLPCHLRPPKPTLSLNLYVKGCLDCTIAAFHVHTSGAFSPSVLSFRMRSRSSMPSCASSSMDLVVTTSCDLTLQTCLIIALSFRCRPWRFGFVNGQVSLAWSIAHFGFRGDKCIKKWELSLLHTTPLLVLIYVSTKFYQNISTI